MLEYEARAILEPFMNQYEILSCGACEDYINDGFCAVLIAKKPMQTSTRQINYGSAHIEINEPYVYIRKGFGEDIVAAMNMVV